VLVAAVTPDGRVVLQNVAEEPRDAEVAVSSHNGSRRIRLAPRGLATA